MKNEIKRVLRTDFLAFARKAIRELDGTLVSDDQYLEYLATYLMAVADGKTKRLLINMPPRHLKTLLASICLPAWVLAHEPNKKIMVVTYSEDLAHYIASSIRAILCADWFMKLFDTRIAKGHAAAMNFATAAGGALYAASIDGSVTGFGADLIIVDDPHNITDAGHPKQLERTIERFDTIIMSRLNNRKKGRIVVIAHRIHDADLPAHLIAGGGWTHAVLPLIATCDQTYETAYGPWHRRKDTLLRPDADDLHEAKRLRAKHVNPPFDLLYQQDADGQALPSITADHFANYIPGSLGSVSHVISIDTGTDEGDRRSFSVIQVWATNGANHFLVAQYRERCDFEDLLRAARLSCRRYSQSPVLIEATANGPALISKLKRMWPKRVVAITPRGSKSTRLRPHIEQIVAGRVRLPLGEPFCQGFVDEFLCFPHGRHTDQVDAFSQYLSWVTDNPELLATTNSRPAFAAVGLNSSYSGRNPRWQPKPQDPGIMVVSGSHNRMPNAPFPSVKAWVKY